MTKPKCPECGKNEFSYEKIDHRKGTGSNDKAYLIFCDNCGTIVGSGATYFAIG